MNETVLVIGAGASVNVGLPTGVQLKSKIKKALDFEFASGFGEQVGGDKRIGKSLIDYCIAEKLDFDHYYKKAGQVRNKLDGADSIDEFLSSLRHEKDLSLIAKLSIASILLEDERKSNIFKYVQSQNDTVDFSLLTNTEKKSWHVPFFRWLNKGFNLDELAERFKKLTLIIFNYDRCVEYFLFVTLKNFHSLSDVQTLKLMGNIEIIHPYGTLGNLPQLDSINSVRFGDDSLNLIDIASNIITYGEDKMQSTLIEKIKMKISFSQRLLFLGFGFNQPNMDLLAPRQFNKKVSKNCFATTYGFSESDQSYLKDRIRTSLKVPKTHPYFNINTVDGSCLRLFDDFKLQLS